MSLRASIKMSDITAENAREVIREHIDNPEQFSHNLVGITLRMVERTEGREAANAIVRDMDLFEEFGISEQNDGVV